MHVHNLSSIPKLTAASLNVLPDKSLQGEALPLPVQLQHIVLFGRFVLQFCFLGHTFLQMSLCFPEGLSPVLHHGLCKSQLVVTDINP